ncbi:hypothetical protein HETIRDRAFT_442522 [Heterobasidion irregulare TC 32-1]|uniref:Uncharacterized protein n=1 Tax=Heterobasidion irregulare (strain TC 32-1) TaxID=747525 RepID=W4JP30_HETIT|nr:uncharacterized protein HETIRDRAFT_442522 [Heterobasidion irregulare TC 32-1]ETW75312.1 hypothetical protein HETIRDRAFT_442522 [Heterobasidion irregulare TC 32-1]
MCDLGGPHQGSTCNSLQRQSIHPQDSLIGNGESLDEMFNRMEFSNSLQRQSIHPQDSLIGNERIINTKTCGKFLTSNKIQDVRQQLCDCVISLDRPQQDLTTEFSTTRLSASFINKTLQRQDLRHPSTATLLYGKIPTSVTSRFIKRQEQDSRQSATTMLSNVSPRSLISRYSKSLTIQPLHEA